MTVLTAFETTLEEIYLQSEPDSLPETQALLLCDSSFHVKKATSRFHDVLGIEQGAILAKTQNLIALLESAGSFDIPASHPLRTLEGSIPGVRSFVLEKLDQSKSVSLRIYPAGKKHWLISIEEKYSLTDDGHDELRLSMDSLTGLLTREALVRQAVGQVFNTSEPFALMLIDLDRFKLVNDSLGHGVGDTLLGRVARRLRSSVREQDVIARMGGDEFAVLIHLSSAGLGVVEQIADRIVQMASRPYLIRGQQLHVGASIGVALAPQDGQDWDTLLRNSELALYDSKTRGGNRSSFFRDEMARQIQARCILEGDLRKALALQHFELYFQPQTDIHTGKILGFEALIRWNHPQRGLVSPAEFIPLAEELGLIRPIGDWVLRIACQAAATWPEEIRVAVNVSPVQFEGGQLVTSVQRALQEADLPAHRLEVEITEGVLLQYDKTAVDILKELKALGVHIAMDDFGTGYSSLSQLANFPFDRIKIDRSFMGNSEGDGTRRAIVKAIAGLGATLGFDTLAEGVETMEQLDNIRKDGCDSVQGYLYSRPVPASDVHALIARLARQALDNSL